MKIVITGSTGMIGLALINLLKDEHEIIAIVRPDSKNNEKIPEHSNITKIECNIDNYDSLNDKIVSADLFFHLAWAKTYGIKGRNDLYSQLNNVKYTLDAVKLACNLNCKSFVSTGSQAEYGIQNIKLDENTPVNPQTGYGIAKYTAGKLSRILAKEYGIKHCWTRIVSTYGPGETHTLIGSLIKAIVENKAFDTTNADQIWNYIYSKDCANALYKIALDGKDGETYLIAGEEEKQLKEYIEIVRNTINPDYKIGFGKREYNPDQVMYLSADISKLKEDTNFKIEYSFEEGIKETVDWFLNHS